MNYRKEFFERFVPVVRLLLTHRSHVIGDRRQFGDNMAKNHKSVTKYVKDPPARRTASKKMNERKKSVCNRIIESCAGKERKKE
uniref:Uncharacterized protein n=1 Tax=Caenorhabditis japonica TaxID=281687 RepID=A0A8R1EQH5_CAEJA